MMRHAVLVLLLAALGACTSMLQSRQPPPVTYVLRPATVATAATSSETTLESVQVLDVVAYPGLDTDAILLTDVANRKLDVFAASRWPERLPRVLETHIQDALRAWCPRRARCCGTVSGSSHGACDCAPLRCRVPLAGCCTHLSSGARCGGRRA